MAGGPQGKEADKEAGEEIATHDRLGRYKRVASVSEKERASTKEVGESRRYSWNMPIGMYKEISYVAETEHINFPRAVLMLCRRGLKLWREQKEKMRTPILQPASFNLGKFRPRSSSPVEVAVSLAPPDFIRLLRLSLCVLVHDKFYKVEQRLILFLRCSHCDDGTLLQDSHIYR